MNRVVGDRFGAAHRVADAVLYEGYILYPYRASARKNQLRWQFGVLTPKAFSEVDGSERSSVRTECLVGPGVDAVLHVRVRCLHLQRRSAEVCGDHDPDTFLPAAEMEIDGVRHVDWDEAVEVVIDLPPLTLGDPRSSVHRRCFHLDASTETETLHRHDGAVGGRLVRRREEVDGTVAVVIDPGGPVGDGYTRISVTIENATPWNAAGSSREEALAFSLLAVHTMLAVEGARFVSLMDPPPAAMQPVAACRSEGTYPVLIGDDDVVLSSPIILYDHPEVAPESPGDLYDATEIDEILALRILTLTDDEKAEARGTDARAAAIIDRCEGLSPEAWERLHGALRSPEPGDAEERSGTEGAPWWDPGADRSVDPSHDRAVVAGTTVGRGSRVRLRPTRRADAQDLFLKDRTATVAGVFRDVEDREYVAVTLEDDPAAAELDWQGRYLYFFPDELDPL